MFCIQIGLTSHCLYSNRIILCKNFTMFASMLMDLSLAYNHQREKLGLWQMQPEWDRAYQRIHLLCVCRCVGGGWVVCRCVGGVQVCRWFLGGVCWYVGGVQVVCGWFVGGVCKYVGGVWVCGCVSEDVSNTDLPGVHCIFQASCSSLFFVHSSSSQHFPGKVCQLTCKH